MTNLKRDDGRNARLGAASSFIRVGLWLLALVLVSCGPADSGFKPTVDTGSTRSALIKGPPPERVVAAREAAATSAGEQTVWVMMKQRANLASVSKHATWKARGAAVHKALNATANQSQASLRSALSSRGIKFKPFWIVNTVKVTADAATIAELGKRSDVERIVPDGAYSLPPVGPGTSVVTPSTVEWNIEKIRASEAWAEFGAEGDGIVVANIDTGVDFEHPALVGQYRGNLGEGTFDHNYNWYDPAEICDPGAPCDNYGHGTHTMGTMVGDDGEGNQIGVAPHAKWMAAKGCEDYYCSYESLLAAGQWIMAPTDLDGENPRTDLRPNIVNNSWGGGSGDDFYRETVQAWVAAGIFPAFSAGNSGEYGCASANSPGDYPESYAAGAFDEYDEIAWFSSRGPSAFDGIIKPNIAAPGVNVRSSVPGGDYESWEGTSMASPHIAGTVALIWSVAPSLIGSIDETRAVLDQSAVDTPDDSCGGEDGNNDVWGEGKIDAYEALAISPIGPAGKLQGDVTDENNHQVSGASVRMVGAEVDRSTRTNSEGRYNAALPVGTYEVTVRAFAYVTQTVSGVEIIEDGITQQDFVVVLAPAHSVSGTVVDGDGNPLEGVEVTIVDTPLSQQITDASGAYSFEAVPEGEYTITANLDGCHESAEAPLSVVDDMVQDFTLPRHFDEYGYGCESAPFEYIEATHALPFYGDWDMAEVQLPFQMLLYGNSYDKMSVTEDGFLTFGRFNWDFPTNSKIPNPALPNAAIYPFWDDLFFNSEDSAVLTETLGTAPNRQFVVEWRDLSSWSSEEGIVSFEIVLYETGKILMQYETAEDGPVEQGKSATIGIENAEGTVALQYSYNQPVLESGTSVMYAVPHAGIVQGTVLDGNDGLPIKAARITAVGSDGPPRSTETDSSGVYRLLAPEGSYTVTASAENYADQSAQATVAEDQTTEQTFTLATGRATVAPTFVQLVAPTGQTRTRYVQLGNTGTLGIDYTIKEAGGRKLAVNVSGKRPRNPGADPAARTTRDLYEGPISPHAVVPLAPGDILSSFAPSGMQLAWGIGYLGNLWLSDAYTITNWEWTTGGLATGVQWPASWGGGYWAGDMAFDTAHGLMCQVNVGGDNGIYCWDTTTGEVMDSITGSFEWTGISQRGLAYRPDDDSFYIGGWNDGIIYHVAGLSSPNKGEVIESCTPADGSIAGLAWNSSVQVLWASTNSEEDTIYELDPNDCTVLSTVAHPGPGYNGAGLELDDAGDLWMIRQDPNEVFLVESGVPAFSDVSWLTVTPESGPLAAGGTQSLKLGINTTGLEPGVYLASAFVLSNSGREPRLRIPISLIVTAYQQPIDVGSTKAYTDSLGDPWVADKAYKAGGWGYVQKGSVVTTNKAISGTNDPKLFQTQRENPYAYRFDSVPNGVYQIDLGFAELSKLRVGKRLFDVIVEDTLVLPAHDIVYEVGNYAAEDRTFFIEVIDGRLDVRLVPRAGYSKPVLNALRVTHRPDR